ncbi:expressed unknown protein [Seminavis robusta]|uniref:Uncharacterized protein n=1 Tax=Seminavis robusta TaxID=568900 RepID=A0A9N8HRY3_9STRA|nr:expressed unknown protein [Seminavis robusta]|eukprot:Sro1325_g262950.1 n/a (294) ;mRNA; f:21868-22749
MPLTEDMRAVTWCDGDLAQLATNVDDGFIKKFKDAKIWVCKQSAARTGTEQPCDLCPGFKSIHFQQKNFTMQDVPRGADDWKDEVVEVIQKADSLGLNLPDNKRRALAEFICGLPQITLTAITPRIVKHGFYQNGILAEHNSESKYAFPNLDRMISTCRTTIPTTLRQKCWDDYARLAAFYNAYPSKYAKKTVDPALRRGYHENLRQYIALGYPLAKDVKDLVDVFGLKAADNQWIKSMRYRTKNGQAIQLADQHRRAMHYLMECGLKLCLAPACDISVNAGWEQATGCYGKD